MLKARQTRVGSVEYFWGEGEAGKGTFSIMPARDEKQDKRKERSCILSSFEIKTNSCSEQQLNEFRRKREFELFGVMTSPILLDIMIE